MVDSAVETVTTYSPYGKLLAQAGASGTTYGYTGEQHDGATGLVYLRARYYDADLKVFLTRDPFPGAPTIPASQHPYTYVHNNPVNLTDPSGNCAEPLSGTACVIIVAGVVIAVVVIYVASDAITDALMPHVPDMSRAAMDFVEYCRTLIVDSTKSETEAERQAREHVNSLPEYEPQPTPLGPDFVPATPTRNPKKKHIALGLNRRNMLVDFFVNLNKALRPRNINVYMYGTWDPDLTPSGNFHSEFLTAASNADAIHFNLEGILDTPGVSDYHDFAAQGKARPSRFTAWELYQIKSNPTFCVKTTFYKRGSVDLTPSTTAWSDICGGSGGN
jgi:RHS repeat-associated protein